ERSKGLIAFSQCRPVSGIESERRVERRSRFRHMALRCYELTAFPYELVVDPLEEYLHFSEWLRRRVGEDRGRQHVAALLGVVDVVVIEPTLHVVDRDRGQLPQHRHRTSEIAAIDDPPNTLGNLLLVERSRPEPGRKAYPRMDRWIDQFQEDNEQR